MCLVGLFAVTVVAAGATLVRAGCSESERSAISVPGCRLHDVERADRNAILMFDRLADGRLVRAGAVSTGGTGTGAGLGNQGGLVLSGNEKWLLAVNAGSNSISVLEVRRRGLRLVEVQPSGGIRPVSVTEHRGLVYVLNAGSDSITGFTLGRDGRLRPLDGSTRSLSGAGTDPAQIAFTPDGDVLVVTEKATNKIVTFEIDRHGLPGDAPRAGFEWPDAVRLRVRQTRPAVRLRSLRRRRERERDVLVRHRPATEC